MYINSLDVDVASCPLAQLRNACANIPTSTSWGYYRDDAHKFMVVVEVGRKGYRLTVEILWVPGLGFCEW